MKRFVGAAKQDLFLKTNTHIYSMPKEITQAAYYTQYPNTNSNLKEQNQFKRLRIEQY